MVRAVSARQVTVAAKGQKSMADAFLESAKDYRLAQELYNSAQAADIPFNVGKAAQRAVFAGAVGGPVAAGVEAGVDVLGHAASRRAGYAASRVLKSCGRQGRTRRAQSSARENRRRSAYRPGDSRSVRDRTRSQRRRRRRTLSHARRTRRGAGR